MTTMQLIANSILDIVNPVSGLSPVLRSAVDNIKQAILESQLRALSTVWNCHCIMASYLYSAKCRQDIRRVFPSRLRTPDGCCHI